MSSYAFYAPGTTNEDHRYKWVSRGQRIRVYYFPRNGLNRHEITYTHFMGIMRIVPDMAYLMIFLTKNAIPIIRWISPNENEAFAMFLSVVKQTDTSSISRWDSAGRRFVVVKKEFL